LKKFIQFIASSFLGVDNKVSSRKATAFVATLMYVVTTLLFYYKVSAASWLLLALIVHPVFILLLFGILTAQHILQFQKNLNKTKEGSKEDEK
jgi:Flp pilus assembly protein TadB